MLKQADMNIPGDVLFEVVCAGVLRELRASMSDSVIVCGAGKSAGKLMFFLPANGIDIEYFIDSASSDGRFFNYELKTFSEGVCDVDLPVVIAGDNDFYSDLRNCIDCGFENICHMFKTELTPFNIKAASRLRKMIKAFNKKGRKYCVWGTGRHTDKIFGLVNDIIANDVCFVSENNETEEYRGHKVFEPAELPGEIEHVIISSDAYESQMVMKSRSVFSGNRVFHRLYENPIKNWERLSAIFSSSNIGIMLGGGSIASFADNEPEIKKIDFLYASINEFWIAQNNFLGPINRKFRLIVQLAGFDYYRFVPDTVLYLKKNPECFLIVKKKFVTDLYNRYGWEKARGKLRGIEKQIIYYEDLDNLFNISSGLPEGANTLFAMLYILALLRPASVFLFGADGADYGMENEIDTYFSPEARKDKKRVSNVARDTMVFNSAFRPFFSEFTGKHALPAMKVVNCSPKSYLKIFEKTDYKGLIEIVRDIQEGGKGNV